MWYPNSAYKTAQAIFDFNPEQMKMYADVDARAGVWEPEGIVEIKMRRDEILKLMERLDPVFATLKEESVGQPETAGERATAVEKLAARENHLEPPYLLYADLHESVFFFCLPVFMMSLTI